MRRSLACLMLLACKAEPVEKDTPVVLVPASIAIENLHHQIGRAERQGRFGREQLVELLLVKWQLLGDTGALDRIVELVETGEERSAEGLLLRASARAALHRFADALEDLAKAEALGLEPEIVAAERAKIFVATGRAEEAIAGLEAAAKARPGFATMTALANAYAAAGRFDEAEQAYLESIRDLNGTSPFPLAWVSFARGVMWSERAGDPARGASLYAKAIEYLPSYPAANVHLAEIEAKRGEVGRALERLRAIAKSAGDPEPLVLLGALDPKSGAIEEAKARYEALLAKHPLAFADHAAELYLGPGADPGRAWSLAKLNAANRETERSLALAIRAARAAGEKEATCALVRRAKAKERSGVELKGLLDGC